MFKRLVIIIAIITLFTVSISADHGGDHVTVDEILSMVDYIIDPGSSQLNPAEAKFCDGRIDITDISSHINALINRQTPESQCSLCGNNVIETGEVCDGTSLAGQSCTTRGFTGGTISCSVDCLSFNTNLCTTTLCGNNVVETGEVCDGSSLAGQSCSTRGFTGGTISCSVDCRSFNTNLCTTTLCGNNVVETGEVCDDGNTITELSCSYGTASCSGCSSNCGQVLNLVGP